MRVLHLNLKKKWFDMILSGEKKEEYRDISDHYRPRLLNREYDVIRFRNGFQRDARIMEVEFKGTTKGAGLPQWGAPPLGTVNVYIIKLGVILNTPAEYRQKD